ncbi:MAG: hypothetical protein ACI4J0_08260 [Huintestinicola sp.]|uniref:hypothetical protein n=1 Tax=Huintestinicola sp. TaxID=2981661 RepID=UPI003F06438A
MGSYITTYMKSVEAALEDENTDWQALKREHLVQIEFIQHERLIHLIVTVMCCLLLFIGLCVFFMSQLMPFLIVDGLLLILDFCYLIYYCFIENSTQKLYRLYNRICAKAEPENKTVADILTDQKLT